MECEHGKSLGIYCRECGPVKSRDSGPLQSGVIKPCSKQEIENRLEYISIKVTNFDNYNDVDGVKEHYELVDEYFELVKELRAL
jgi:hypothetical protein